MIDGFEIEFDQCDAIQSGTRPHGFGSMFAKACCIREGISPTARSRRASNWIPTISRWVPIISRNRPLQAASCHTATMAKMQVKLGFARPEDDPKAVAARKNCDG